MEEMAVSFLFGCGAVLVDISYFSASHPFFILNLYIFNIKKIDTIDITISVAAAKTNDPVFIP